MRNIEQEIKDYFKSKSEKCTVYFYEDHCRIELINSNCFNFETMMWLSEFFGTRKIDGEEPYTLSAGCETCGHGSAVQQTINISQVIWPEGFSIKKKR